MIHLLFSIIVSVRETCADWIRGIEPHDDPATKGKKDPETGFDIQVPRRNVGMNHKKSEQISFNNLSQQERSYKDGLLN